MTQEIMVYPRVKGRAGVNIERPQDWHFEIQLFPGPGIEPIILTSKQAYVSEAEANYQMRALIPGLLEEILKGAGLPKPSGFLDLKNNKRVGVEEFVKGEDGPLQ